MSVEQSITIGVIDSELAALSLHNVQSFLIMKTSRIGLAYPFPDEKVFRYQAMQDVLDVLIRAPHEEFTLAELSTVVGASHSTIWRAIDLLQHLDVIVVRSDGELQVAVNPDAVDITDPILAIPQSEFHAPVRMFLEESRTRCESADEIDDLVGIILFGSVARGEADRLSDIDLFAVIDGNKTHGRRVLSEIAADLKQEDINGDRYEFQVLVETPESVERIGGQLREIFDEGFTLHESPEMHSLWTVVYVDD